MSWIGETKTELDRLTRDLKCMSRREERESKRRPKMSGSTREEMSQLLLAKLRTVRAAEIHDDNLARRVYRASKQETAVLRDALDDIADQAIHDAHKLATMLAACETVEDES